MKNLVLVGFMGSGKTAIGRRVAERLGLTFVDMDTEIESKAGRKISDLFASEGESYFRYLERRETMELAKKQGQVIATGGGVVLDPDNLKDFGNTGVVVCLWVDAETAFERTQRAAHRPLLEADDRRKKIEDLLAKRMPLYKQIDNVVDTRGRSLETLVEDVMRIYRGAEGSN